MDCSPQAALSMEFSRQEYWSRLPLPTPGYIPDLGIKPVFSCIGRWLFYPEPPGSLLFWFLMASCVAAFTEAPPPVPF